MPSLPSATLGLPLPLPQQTGPPIPAQDLNAQQAYAYGLAQAQAQAQVNAHAQAQAQAQAQLQQLQQLQALQANALASTQQSSPSQAPPQATPQAQLYMALHQLGESQQYFGNTMMQLAEQRKNLSSLLVAAQAQGLVGEQPGITDHTPTPPVSTLSSSLNGAIPISGGELPFELGRASPDA